MYLFILSINIIKSEEKRNQDTHIKDETLEEREHVLYMFMEGRHYGDFLFVPTKKKKQQKDYRGLICLVQR